jgi:hypothetical protein
VRLPCVVPSAPVRLPLAPRIVVAALALSAAGCHYTPETTVTVRDPSAVRVEIDEGKGLRTLLAPGAAGGAAGDFVAEPEVTLPDTAPPFQPGLRGKTAVRRLPRGAIEVRCADCSPDVKTLVPIDGQLTLGENFRVEKFDFAQREMRIHFTDSRDGLYGTASAYEADVVTPWTNVALVRRVSTPDRGLGVKLLLSGAIVAALGGLTLGDGVADNHPSITVFGAFVLPLAAVLAAVGGWYALAPADDHVLFQGH